MPKGSPLSWVRVQRGLPSLPPAPQEVFPSCLFRPWPSLWPCSVSLSRYRVPPRRSRGPTGAAQNGSRSQGRGLRAYVPLHTLPRSTFQHWLARACEHLRVFHPGNRGEQSVDGSHCGKAGAAGEAGGGFQVGLPCSGAFGSGITCKEWGLEKVCLSLNPSYASH